MYLRQLLASSPRNVTKNVIFVNGLKTTCNLKHDFLLPQLRNHLFGNEGCHDHDQNSSKNIVSNESSVSEIMGIPPLYGNNIQSHVHEIAERQTLSYRSLLNHLAHITRPAIPNKWLLQSGWTRYRDGFEPERIAYPDEDSLCFDAEVCVREGFAPVLATAVSSTSWYCWVSPTLLNCTEQKIKPVVIDDLISLGNQREKPRIVVGHFVCYDSARVKESYDLSLSSLKFFDTLAAHVSISGITDLQKYFLLKAPEKPKWANLASGNSLSQLHLLYCGKDVNKAERDVFVKGTLSDIAERFQELCTYCAYDVEATHSVFCKIFPIFCERFPHGATLSAMLDLTSMFLPVTRNLKAVVDNVQETSIQKEKEAKLLLQELAEDALQLMTNENYKDDPWMWDQDWYVSTKKKRQIKKNTLGQLPEARVYPEWYQKLASQVDSQTLSEVGIPVTFRMNIAAKLMQLCWGIYPLHYEHSHGWGMLIPATKVTEVTTSSVPVSSIKKLCDSYSVRPRVSSIPTWSDFATLQNGITASNSALRKGSYGFKMVREESYSEFFLQRNLIFKKLPHNMSLEKNVGTALSLHLLLNPSLRSVNKKSQKILDILRKNVFWRRNGKNFKVLPVVWFDENCESGGVVPSCFACTDFTRLPKEELFTSLNCESVEKLGTEVSKALCAPDGWCFLSANVPDSDMWVASLLADSECEEYCCTPLGKMFVEGCLYSSVAEYMNITTLQAEWLVHAVLWGANRTFLGTAFRQINPIVSRLAAQQRSEKLLNYLSGYCSGSLPDADKSVGIFTGFNKKLLKLIKSENLVTPFLHSRLSRVLEKDSKKFTPLIQNWLVRSSVVDYLHVFMLCFRDFVPSARVCSVSSFKKMYVKYLVPESEKLHAARSLHLSHLYATAFCAAQAGLSDVPKIAAELPFVTLSSGFREDLSHDSLKLTFSEAMMHPVQETLRNSPLS